MKTFLFEKYGYYPTILENYTFSINNWQFSLIEVDVIEEDVEKIEQYTPFLRQQFSGVGPFIIKTRDGKNISSYGEKKYVLVCTYKKNMSLPDLFSLHTSSINPSSRINLNNVIELWKEKLDIIEKGGINSLRIDSYSYGENVEIILYVIGLCQNAIQYLSEVIIDYGQEIDNLTICHKRINNLDSFDFLNPFNFIVDHPLRDYSELFKSGFLQTNDLIESLNKYSLNSKTASLLMARILYPTTVFDKIESNAYISDQNFKINYSIEKENLRIKNIYNFLVSKYNIRPIRWL